MSFEPSATQALLLWKMIIGATSEERRPMLSQITPHQRNSLLTHGFLLKESGKSKKGAKAQFLVLSDSAWEWASHARGVEFNLAPTAARALQGLLRRLVPFLERRDIPLADLFRDNEPAPASSAQQRAEPLKASAEPPAAEAPALGGNSLRMRIEQACLSLSGGAKKSRVRLSALRKALPAISRQQLDTTLIELQRERRLVLFREDNTPSLTPEDHAAALLVGDSPRHLVYLEA